MSQFLTHLRLDDENGFPMMVIDPFLFYSDLIGMTIRVPAGFETDLASIPRILWAVLPKVGRWDRAAVVHDFLYVEGKANGVEISRSTADHVMFEAMTVCDVPLHQRYIIFLGVRLGGWLGWHQRRKADPKGISCSVVQ